MAILAAYLRVWKNDKTRIAAASDLPWFCIFCADSKRQSGERSLKQVKSLGQPFLFLHISEPF